MCENNSHRNNTHWPKRDERTSCSPAYVQDIYDRCSRVDEGGC